MFRSVAVVSAAAGVAADSFTNCASADAHMKNFKITASPDPPVLGEDVTITVSGALDKQVTGGTATISVKAGPINFPLTIPFKNNAADPSKFVAGTEQTITVGPFTYPNINVPLIKTTKGSFELKDQDGEEVSCVNFELPAYSATAPASKLGDDPFVDCSGADAHVKNKKLDVEPPTIKKGVPFTVSGSGDLDEDIASGIADVSVDLSLFKLDLSVPFAMEPAIKATHADLTVGPITMPSIPLIPNAKGSIKVNDANSEELICYNFNVPVAETVTV
jgi:hypothetical protein